MTTAHCNLTSCTFVGFCLLLLVRNSLQTFISLPFGRENDEQGRVEVCSTFWDIS